jgi:hypothetical protein
MKLDDDYTILTDEESVEWRRIYIEPGQALLQGIHGFHKVSHLDRLTEKLLKIWFGFQPHLFKGGGLSSFFEDKPGGSRISIG